jgi:CheY-like chemotaxis protein
MKDILKGESLKIIIADNDPEDQEIIKVALKEVNEHHDIIFASNGEDLLSKLTELKNKKLPDLIFLDLNMPIKDGRITLKELKNSTDFSKIPVFIYTSSASSNDVNLCYEEGASLFIKKPSDFNKINVIIKSLCNFFNEYVSLPT